MKLKSRILPYLALLCACICMAPNSLAVYGKENKAPDKKTTPVSSGSGKHEHKRPTPISLPTHVIVELAEKSELSLLEKEKLRDYVNRKTLDHEPSSLHKAITEYPQLAMLSEWYKKNKDIVSGEINQYDFKHETPLHIAIYNQLFGHVVFLLNNKANPCLQNYAGDNALHIAIKIKDLRLVKLLLKKCFYFVEEMVAAKNKDGKTPLDLLREDSITKMKEIDDWELIETFLEDHLRLI